jgi:hypothetical protein
LNSGIIRPLGKTEDILESVGNIMLENPTLPAAGPAATNTQRRSGSPPTGPQGGQAIAEFAFAFPLQLLIMFAIMQLAMMYVAKEVLTYASYSAARSAMVADAAGRDPVESARKSAALICAPITGPSVAGSSASRAYLNAARIEVPGWGPIPNSGVSRGLKTIISGYREEEGEVEVTVTHYYELSFPVVGRVFAWLHRTSPRDVETVAGPRGTGGTTLEADYERMMGLWSIDSPHVRLRETTRLAVPGG